MRSLLFEHKKKRILALNWNTLTDTSLICNQILNERVNVR